MRIDDYIGDGQQMLPPIVFEEDREYLDSVAIAMDQFMKRASHDEIRGKIITLLSHYYTPDVDERIWSMIFQDWCDDLEEFPLWVIRNACRDYRRANSSKRPTPANIRNLCIDEFSHHRKLFELIMRTIVHNEQPAISDLQKQTQIISDEERDEILKKFDDFRSWANEQDSQNVHG